MVGSLFKDPSEVAVRLVFDINKIINERGWSEGGNTCITVLCSDQKYQRGQFN